MQIQFGCFKCIFNMICDMAQKAFADDARRRELIEKLTQAVLKNSSKCTPPEMASILYSCGFFVNSVKNGCHFRRSAF